MTNVQLSTPGTTEWLSRNAPLTCLIGTTYSSTPTPSTDGFATPSSEGFFDQPRRSLASVDEAMIEDEDVPNLERVYPVGTVCQASFLVTFVCRVNSLRRRKIGSNLPSTDRNLACIL